MTCASNLCLNGWVSCYQTLFNAERTRCCTRKPHPHLPAAHSISVRGDDEHGHTFHTRGDQRRPPFGDHHPFLSCRRCVPLDWSIQPNWQALHQFMISARVGVGGSGHLELDRAASVYTQVVLASFASIAWAILLAWVPQVLCVRVNYPMVNAGFGGENRGSCGVESAVYHRPADGGWWQPRHAGAGGLVQPATPRTHLLPVFCGTAAARHGSRGEEGLMAGGMIV